MAHQNLGNAIPIFVSVYCLRPTQIFTFSEKNSYAEGNKGNETLLQTIVTLIWSMSNFLPYRFLALTSYFDYREHSLFNERLPVRLIAKHLSRVALFVPAACHPALFAACHWSLAGSGALLAHRIHDLVDGSCLVVDSCLCLQSATPTANFFKFSAWIVELIDRVSAWNILPDNEDAA